MPPRQELRPAVCIAAGPLVRLGGPDAPAMGFAAALEHAFMPDTDRIYEQMLELARF